MLNHSAATRRITSPRPWIALWLTLAMLIVPMGVASAEETVTSIYYESGSSAMSLYVGEDDQLRVWANLSGGSTSSKDITLDAAWTSSNSQIVKVDKGLITAVGAGYADITAKYKTASPVTVRVTVTYEYDKVEIALSPSTTPAAGSIDVQLGTSPQLTARAYKGSADIEVTNDAAWSSSNVNIATVDDGTITLIGAGTVTILAKYKGKSDSVTLNVTSPYKSMTISPSSLMEFKVGDDDKELSASVERKTGGSESVTDSAVWRTANAAIATVEKGVVTPVGTGTTTVTASYLGVTKSVQVVVHPSHQAMNISEKKPVHLVVSELPKQLTVTVSDNAVMTPLDVTAAAEWESSNPYVATVSNAGLVTPKAVGTAKITASYKGLSRSVTFNVYPSITKVEITEETIDGFIGGKGDLPPVDGTSLSDEVADISDLVVWTTSDSAIVTIEDGKWVAKKIGEATLTATVRSKSDSVKIIVHQKPLALLTEITDISIVIGKTAKLPDLTMLYENGEEDKDVDTKVKWTASSPNVLITGDEIKGLLASKVNLTAAYLGKTVTVRVSVEEEIVSLVADPTSLLLNPGKSKSIKVTGFYKNGKKISLGSKMNWTFSNEEIASLKSSKSLKAIAEGSGTLKGSYQGKTIEIPVVVKAKLKKLTVSESSLKLTPGNKKTIILTAEYEGGRRTTVTSGAIWTTSKAQVAVVTIDGTITAIGKGSASIKASYEGKSVTVRVSVK